jgi:hypothetical protein
MKELSEYRERLLNRFHEAAWEFRAACEAAGDPFARDGGWSLHQIVSHTRDVQRLVYGARIRRTLLEDNPQFETFDADEWMAAHYNPQEPLAGILNELTQDVDELCAVLSGTPRETWSREGCHPELGRGLTLQFWVERSLAHVQEHLLDVKKLKGN